MQNKKMKKLLCWLVIFSFIFTSFVFTSATDEPEFELGVVPIVEVVVGTDTVNALIADGLDILSIDNSDEGVFKVTIMVHDYERDYFADNNINYTVVVENAVAQVNWLGYQTTKPQGIVAAAAPITGYPHNVRQPNLVFNPNAVFDPEDVLFNDKYGFPERLGYRSVTDHYSEMNYLALEYPDIVKKHVLGTTYEGKPIIALEICNQPGVSDGRPESIHIAGNHAREWPSTEYCMNLAWYLVTQYGTNEQITNILDTTKVWLMSITNPDGQHFDQTGNTPGTFRRNRVPVAWNAQGNPSAYGVDLNRNYAYDWGSNQGSSGTTGSDTYRGTAPFSEFETQAIRDIYTNNQIMTAITGHTWGELIQYPWAYDLSAAHPDLVELGRDLSRICLYADQPSSAMYYSNGGHCDYVYATMGVLTNTFEHGSQGFIRPYMGEDLYGLYGALAPYNDFNGSQRRIPLTYNYASNAAAFGPPAAPVTAPVIFIDGTNFNAGYGDSNRFSTVAKVQALGDRVAGKILMTNRAQSNNAAGTDAASRTANAAVARAAQDLGAVGVIFCGNTATGTTSNDVNTDYYTGAGYGSAANLIGTTGDALQVRIPVAGTLKVMCREYFEWVQNGGENTLTLTSTPQPGGGSIYYHWEKLAGAFLYNIEAAHKYASHIQGQVLDSDGALLPEAALNLKLEIKSRLWASNDNATKTLPHANNPYVEWRTSHLDVIGGAFDWAVTPSAQPHFANDGYEVTASAGGKYDQTQNIVVANRKELVEDVEFVLPDAVKADFNFDMTWPGNRELKVPFSTYVLGDSGDYSYKGEVDGFVYATINGEPVDVVDLGGGDYLAVFNAENDFGIFEGDVDLVINFDGGPAHSAYKNTITLSTITNIKATFSKIVETAKNSRVWVLSFSADITYANGVTEYMQFTVDLNGNNANLDGVYKFGADHFLAGYTLTYDIKGNGSNIKAFSIN